MRTNSADDVKDHERTEHAANAELWRHGRGKQPKTCAPNVSGLPTGNSGNAGMAAPDPTANGSANNDEGSTWKEKFDGKT